ncbi:MAG: FkbM family methyltransferase [Desulfobulbaceae bacterium]|nr:FkbM family methyltransferase [Desulfobulbaceae bacterium]
MSIKSSIRVFARKFGVEIARHNPAQSIEARISTQLEYNKVDCVIDVGANDGGYGRFLRAAGFKGNIVSFEPQANAHARLIKTSHSDHTWKIAQPMALGDVETELEINLAGDSFSSSLLTMLPSHFEASPSSKCSDTEIVKVRRLDSLDEPVIRSAKRIYLKIDTQGYEMPVLLGAKGIMDKVVGIQLEMSVISLYEGQALFQELLTWLDGAGYAMWGVDPGFVNQKTGRMLQFDGIFYRKQ